jgi:peroxiredoxin
MNKLFIIITIVILSVKVQAQHSSLRPPEDADRGFSVKVGQQAPDDFVLKLTNGSVTSLKALRGKVVVLQLTASYCPVCRQKFPVLEKTVWQQLKGQNFELIAVDRDEPLKKAIKFKRDVHITYPMALDPGARIFADFTTKDAGIARDIVIDQNGKIVFLSRLYDPAEYSRMIGIIKQCLNKEAKI